MPKKRISLNTTYFRHSYTSLVYEVQKLDTKSNLGWRPARSLGSTNDISEEQAKAAYRKYVDKVLPGSYRLARVLIYTSTEVIVTGHE